MNQHQKTSGKISFSWQIIALISFGIVALAVIGSVTAAFFINKKLSDIAIDQGRQITKTLAHQSILTLLSDLGDNARDSLDATLSYSNVESIAIFDKNGNLIVGAGEKGQITFTNIPMNAIPFEAVMTSENPDYWEFTAAVYDVDFGDESSGTGFDQLFINNPDLLGYVRVTIDRASLYKIQAQLLKDGLLIFVGLALVLVTIAVLISRHMTRPLLKLAELMNRAEEGEEGIRALPNGPLEVHNMARAFNTMMAALEQRQAYAEDQHNSLLREIDERLLIEQELRDSEYRLVTIFNNVVDGLLILDNTGMVESSNPIAIAMLGPEERLIGRSFKNVINDLSGSDQSLQCADINEVFDFCRGGKHFSIKRDDQAVEIDVNLSEMSIKGSKKYIAIVRNITENQAQKNRIESLLAQHEAIISSVPGIIVELNDTGGVLWCNKHAEQVIGYSAVDLKHRNIYQFFPESDQKKFLDAISTACDEGRIELHAELMTINGVVPYQFNMALVSSVAGGGETILMIGLDDSQSVMAQSALKRARDAALESARIKSEFLANMSHEIRTPMNGMFGMLQLLSGSDLNEEQNSYAEIALRSADQLLHIINDILDFSKIEAGKLELDRIEMSPRTVIEDAVELFSQRAQSKGVNIYAKVDFDVPDIIYGDPTRLNQVVSNLIGNAIKFTDQGHIFVTCSVEQRSIGFFNDPRMVISVKDTGIGIDQKSQALIFESFVQADGSSTRRYSGTGLGLAIVRQLSELMEGGVELKSEVGKGSEFIVTLPISTPDNIDHSLSSPLLHGEGAARYVGRDPIAASIIQEYLRPIGYRLDVVTPEHSFKSEFLAQNYDLYLIEYDENSNALIKQLLGKTQRVVMMVNQDEKGLLFTPPADIALFKLVKPIRYHALLSCFKRNDLHGTEVKSVPGGQKKIPAKIVENKNLRILVVEDNETNQRVINSMLAKLGFQAVNVYDGKAAVARVKQEPFDIIFMDCQMPVMDGYQATAEIRGLEGIQPVIIAMTGNAMEGDREKCLLAGMDDYIAKPVRLTVLQETITKWTEQVAAG